MPLFPELDPQDNTKVTMLETLVAAFLLGVVYMFLCISLQTLFTIVIPAWIVIPVGCAIGWFSRDFVLWIKRHL